MHSLTLTENRVWGERKLWVGLALVIQLNLRELYPSLGRCATFLEVFPVILVAYSGYSKKYERAMKSTAILFVVLDV